MKQNFLDKLSTLKLSEEDYAAAVALYHEKYQDKFLNCITSFDLDGSAKIVAEYLEEVTNTFLKKEKGEEKEEKKEEKKIGMAKLSDVLAEEGYDEDEEDEDLDEDLEEDLDEDGDDDDDFDIYELYDDLRQAAIAELCASKDFEKAKNGVPEVVDTIMQSLLEYRRDPTDCMCAMYNNREHAIEIEYDDHILTGDEKSLIKLFFEGLSFGVEFEDGEDVTIVYLKF